ncbi:MAG TPA: methyltransferase domain-containing protein [Allosphingosinicella sp.]|nr:methyltransferase domain-containing protein [Allosphingosinicella sp.]
MNEAGARRDSPDPPAFAFEARDSCPACGSAAETVYSTPFSEGPIGDFVRDYYHVDPAVLREAPYELDRCRRCGLVYQHYVGGPELLGTLYSSWLEDPEDPERDIATYRDEIRAIPESRDAHELMAAASYLGRPLAGLRTLDYGMGWVLWGRIAAQLGCDSFGSDLAQPRMDFAARHGVRTVTDSEIPGHRFDFINTEQVFEHVPQPLQLLELLAAALAPGGVIKISVPSGERIDRLLEILKEGRFKGDRDTIMPVQPLEHLNCFRRSSIRTMAGLTGLEPVRPGPWHGYAFLRYPRTIRLSRPKKALKELVRPVYQYRNPSNLYVWLRKPGG